MNASKTLIGQISRYRLTRGTEGHWETTRVECGCVTVANCWFAKTMKRTWLVCLKHSRSQESDSELWIYWFIDWGPGLFSKTGMKRIWLISHKNRFAICDYGWTLRDYWFTNRNPLGRKFSLFIVQIDINWKHLWPCRVSIDDCCVNAVCQSTCAIYTYV